jgi:signal transduction histidine kinase
MNFPGTGRPAHARARLALLLLSPVLLIAFLAVVMSVLALADLRTLAGTSTDAGLARIGNDLALVIVTQRGAEIEATRSLIVNWGIITPATAVIAGAFIAWWLAGRIRKAIDTATDKVVTAEIEQTNRLEEILHELRTPLAVMGANLELAWQQPELTDQSAGYVEKARRAIGRMSRTVDDLAGHRGLAVKRGEEPVDLGLLAEAIVEENAAPAAKLGVAVSTTGELPSVYVNRVDPDAVRSAIGNFMANAMRLAPRGSEIVLDCGETEGWAWLAVVDQGPGLAPHHHARVFERGWQGAHSRDRHEGSGLGLTIARQLTEAQGGLVTVESEEGGGAAFTLWLPMYPWADPESVIAIDGVHPVLRPWVRVTSIA